MVAQVHQHHLDQQRLAQAVAQAAQAAQVAQVAKTLLLILVLIQLQENLKYLEEVVLT